jgi:hypothetical protein
MEVLTDLERGSALFECRLCVLKRNCGDKNGEKVLRIDYQQWNFRPREPSRNETNEKRTIDVKLTKIQLEISESSH